ncbi:MAG: rod shape-determining protein MreD [Eggerthellaceae bacterium]|nr:rod shape-determining protein MreD [Eggerthellaceae bacterium]
MERDSLMMVIGAFLAIILQIVLAPNIAIFQATVNFCMLYVLIVALTRPSNNSTLVIAFFFGIIYDLLGHSPVGAMAFLFVIAAFAVSKVFEALDNDTLFIPLAILIVAVFLLELLYAIFMLSFGVVESSQVAFLQRALPCALYNTVVGLLVLILMGKVFTDSTRSSASSRTRDSMHVSMTSNKNLGKVRTKHRF